jgi:hypothetical protein
VSAELVRIDGDIVRNILNAMRKGEAQPRINIGHGFVADVRCAKCALPPEPITNGPEYPLRARCDGRRWRVMNGPHEDMVVCTSRLQWRDGRYMLYMQDDYGPLSDEYYYEVEEIPGD